MKCPNCGEIVKDDAKVCYTCGEDLTKNDIDHIINNMIKEDDAIKASKAKDVKSKSEKSTIDSSSKSSSKSTLKTTSKRNNEASEKPEFGNAVRITVYINAIIIVILLISMLFTWFSFGGRGTLEGFILDQKSAPFMSNEGVNMSLSQLESVDPAIEILKFSPKKLIDYVNLYEDEYKKMPNTNGELKNSYAIIIETIYIRGFYLISIICILSVILMLLDKKLKTIEWTRGFSVLTIIIIGLNYAALKIPFFSMFALKARNILRNDNQLTAVTLNLNGINVSNDFYPYEMMEKTGFFVALAVCAIWFILSTILVELKKDKEFN